MQEFNIQPINLNLTDQIQKKIDLKTKPSGSLGILETIGKQICLIQNTLEPTLQKPSLIICAGDHGITNEGVSPYPQEVTFQMVLNFLSGGAAINVFARQHDIRLKIIDCGVNYDFNDHNSPINCKIDYGTKNFLNEPAMSAEQCNIAISNGAKLVTESHHNGSNIISFGEMGIGNTTSAAAILCKLTGISPIEACGAGTGLDEKGIFHKAQIIEKAITKHQRATTPFEILYTFGGFEIATIVGGMLKAAELGMIIIIDGFIATAALLVANALNNNITDYCIAAHQSNEKAHLFMLQHLNLKPILNLGMRLGEGTGAAVAYPIIQSAVQFINEMSSFEGAGVSKSSSNEVKV
ncbi:MAG: nicotinate-nucleotide--dimethylbenzimidazole phosphoribosyltransferase [Marinilabiliaceae bacterium]|nr:nicotinate-nucleotide--dimethylbenzimidazole phosphoribosyltransferase [Marinilabiliaceae bacterium]